MPFGFTNAPANLQSLVDKMIGHEMQPHVFASLDNVIVIETLFDEHLQWLSKVSGRIREAGVKLNLERCAFRCQQIQYLDYTVNENVLQLDPDKVAPVLSYVDS